MSWWSVKKHLKAGLNPFKPIAHLHTLDDIINKDLGGYGNVATAAGIVAAGILTGGVAAAGAGTAFSTTGAIIGGAAGAGIGAGSLSSGIEAKQAESEAKRETAKQKAEIDAANALAEIQNRAKLLSLRKQVGATNVGAKSTVFAGSSSGSTDKNETGVILG